MNTAFGIIQTPGPTGIDTIEWTFDHEPGNHPVYFSFYTDLYDFYSGATPSDIGRGCPGLKPGTKPIENPYEVTFIDSSMNATHRQWILPDGNTSDAEQFDYAFYRLVTMRSSWRSGMSQVAAPSIRDTIQVYIRDIVAKMKLDPDVCVGTP